MLYWLLCAFLPCRQLATTGRTRLGPVDFKLHHHYQRSGYWGKSLLLPGKAATVTSLPFSQSQGNQEQYGLPSKKDGRKWEGFLANIRYALFVLPRHLLLSSRASVLAREIGKEILVGFPRRIRALCQSRLRVYYGTVRSENIDRLGNERTRACTRDTQDALRSHRWAMLLDHYFCSRLAIRSGMGSSGDGHPGF